jgi:hypothetical protein
VGNPSTCVAHGTEAQPATVSCPTGAGQKIKSIKFAEFGTATGGCKQGFERGGCAADLMGNVSKEGSSVSGLCGWFGVCVCGSIRVCARVCVCVCGACRVCCLNQVHASSDNSAISSHLPTPRHPVFLLFARTGVHWCCQLHGTVSVFRQEFSLEDATGSHACSLEATCDQWHSSRVSTFLFTLYIPFKQH